MDPRYNEGQRYLQNLFATTRFRGIEFFPHTFRFYWGDENRSLYWSFVKLYGGCINRNINLTFFNPKKEEILRSNLKIHQIQKKFPIIQKNRRKYIRKLYFMRYYLFCPVDLVTRAGERVIWPVFAIRETLG